MNADTTSIDHIFKAIGRDFNEEFPALTVIYIIYDDDIERSLNARRAEILQHPAGEDLIGAIEQSYKEQRDKSFFIGLSEHKTDILFGLTKKQSYIGACFIHESDLIDFDDQQFSCKLLGYAIGFEALHELMDAKNKLSDTRTSKHHVKLMRDCFAAMMMESLGHKSAIQTIAKKYADLATRPVPFFKVENHPMLMALDGLNVVYKDRRNEKGAKSKPLSHAYSMSEEIGNTYNDSALKQWLRFSKNSQEMVWAEHSPNEVLSAAIYGTDSPYIRSTAHICAECLNTSPVPLKNADIYNPFADAEINERMHNRICRSEFLKLLETVNETENSSLFLEHAKKQTQRFMDGFPMGWCAPALIEAENAYHLFQEQRNPEEAMIDNAFQSAFTHIKWPNVRELNRMLIHARRNGIEIMPEIALQIIDKNKALVTFKNAFELLKS